MATQQRESNTFGTGTSSVESTKDKAKDAASKAGSYVKDAASDAANKAGSYVKDAASTVAHKAEDAASYVAHKAEDATTSVGQNIKSLAGTIRANAPHEGMLGTAGSAVASTLESCGRELEEHGLGGVADDITSMVRRNPVPAVLIGIGLGFLLARTFAK